LQKVFDPLYFYQAPCRAENHLGLDTIATRPPHVRRYSGIDYPSLAINDATGDRLRNCHHNVRAAR